MVKVNEPTTGLALQAPFGGFKQSSANTFKEQGPAALEFYTRTKTVYITYVLKGADPEGPKVRRQPEARSGQEGATSG